MTEIDLSEFFGNSPEEDEFRAFFEQGYQDARAGCAKLRKLPNAGLEYLTPDFVRRWEREINAYNAGVRSAVVQTILK